MKVADRDVGQASVGELLAEVTSDLSRLMRQELELAKAEVRQEAGKASKAAGMFGGAGFAAYLAVLFLSLALMFALADLIDSVGWAALIVALLWGVVGAVLFTRARAQARTVKPKPEQTIDTLKEDAQWAKTRGR